MQTRPSTCLARLTLALLLGVVAEGWAAAPSPQPFRGPAVLTDVTRAEVDLLTDLGITIDSVKGTTVRVYVSDDELERLQRLGFAVTPEAPVTRPKGGRGGLGTYHDFAGMTGFLEQVATAYPNLVRLESYGNSVLGRDLWAMKITDHPTAEEDEPEFLYLGVMHGDEQVGQEMCLYLIEYLVSRYATDPAVAALVDETELWVVPCLNPDGMEAGHRGNANGYDLNRNFPVPDGSVGQDGTYNLEPETTAVMSFCDRHRFGLGANFHGGALVVSYPWDYTLALTPDQVFLDAVSRGYASRNPPMAASPYFPGGVTRGAVWYYVFGSRSDWLYDQQGGIDLTIELNDVKEPLESTLPALWDDNRAAMLYLIGRSLTGLRGRVTDAVTGRPLAASVNITSLNRPVWTDPDVGDYHRYLMGGTYQVAATAAGYRTRQVAGVAVDGDGITRLDLALDPLAIVCDPTSVTVPEGGSATVGVRLASAPDAPVTVTVQFATGGDPDLTLDERLSLVFTPDDWAVSQTVVIRAAEDADALAGEATLRCEATGWTAAEVTVREADDDLTVTVNAAAHGATVPAGAVVVDPDRGGLPLLIHALPDPGYWFSGWTGDLATVTDPEAARTTIAPAQDAAVTAGFLPIADGDGDGMDDQWEIRYFGSAGAAAAEADPDGDGASNLQEFTAGTSPVLYVVLLTPGWNLIALARLPADPSVSAVFGSLVLGPAWVWVRDHYETTTTVLPLTGHWLYLDGTEAVLVEIPVR